MSPVPNALTFSRNAPEAEDLAEMLEVAFVAKDVQAALSDWRRRWRGSADAARLC